ncbi:type IV secretory system conjugative DNA transfer family protein [Labilibaculum sp. K2S]|uniref:type IV secretory system conjugative DNA transfer family protein n=1 Tax=Labilibaculum sp. K2S TaxID=3056386 RepID=UPI0025A3E6E5|nr:type IV secretory system conjugative DNA transfer family protein [Labilibaculum sp. K2S]MDM8161872.1 type IV secretory system conjugative DNA transfer family protein [Labilibaculum sp. K2S]
MSDESRELVKLHEGFRFFSYFLLILSLYLSQMTFFKGLGIYQIELEALFIKLISIEFLAHPVYSKTVCLVFLIITCIGTKAKKDRELKISTLIFQILFGMIFYWGSLLLVKWQAGLYLLFSFWGFVILNIAFDNISKLINVNLMKDRFNSENESFPQLQELKENEYSVNLPTQFQYKGEIRQGWINVVNPFRGSMVIGTPGSGKSFSVVLPFIKQHLNKEFCMCVYDFKFPDLSQVAYNHFLKAKKKKKLPASSAFYMINFDDIRKSYRCNPLAPELMESPIDAFESSRTVLYNLNREWIRKQGEFFSESAVSFFAAVIWFLKRYQKGQYCTLPHAIELLQLDYDDLFEVLSQEKDVVNIINPFLNAHQRGASEQLEGQLGSLKIAISKIISKEIYWICSGNDFSLDINDPKQPKVICLANNPLRIEMYGAVLSLYITRMLKVMNRKGQHKTSLIFDELPTIYFRGLDTLIATARSNRISILLGMQTIDQLIRDYGKEQANAILTNIGNVFAGQSVGDTAKLIQSRMGKILQERQSVTINKNTQSTSFSTQMDYLVPEGKIATLPQGVMVGQIADNFEQEITQKNFNALIQVDAHQVKREEKHYQSIPDIYLFDDVEAVLENNRSRICEDIQKILLECKRNAQ